MSPQRHPNIDTAVRYHQAVSGFATGEEISAFFHPDVTHHELPNALFPDGSIRDLVGLCAAAEAGRRSLRAQTFEVLNAVAMGDQVALEVLWTGTTAVPLGDLPAGHTLRAHIATFLDFAAGRSSLSGTTTATNASSQLDAPGAPPGWGFSHCVITCCRSGS